ncbi:MAG: hypothetical protein ACI841_000747 [Planctomycetota bacterium]|jgi:hypothetical protein
MPAEKREEMALMRDHRYQSVHSCRSAKLPLSETGGDLRIIL